MNKFIKLELCGRQYALKYNDFLDNDMSYLHINSTQVSVIGEERQCGEAKSFIDLQNGSSYVSRLTPEELLSEIDKQTSPLYKAVNL